MPKTNFSCENEKTYNLTLDLARGDFALHVDSDKVTRKDLEDHLRNTINDDLLKGATLYQAYRRNNITMFEIIEEIVDTTIGEDVMNNPFIEEFVEFKNRKLGDKSAFYSEGGMISAAAFAGNHWDTNRQAMDVGEEFTLPKEWVYVHVYEELERFLLGISSLEKMTDKVYKAINKYIQDRLYVQFQNVADAVPAEFAASGNSEEALGKLCDIVQAAGGYANLTIAGTRGALRKLVNVVPDKMLADSQREAKANTGAIQYWEGHKLMAIPQTLKGNTFELALNDNMVFVMGGDTKPIKLEFIGDTRTDMDTTGKKYNDMSVDLQVQTCFGMGLVLPEYFGTFTFA